MNRRDFLKAGLAIGLGLSANTVLSKVSPVLKKGLKNKKLATPAKSPTTFLILLLSRVALPKQCSKKALPNSEEWESL